MHPEKIGPYEIKAELGRGGMATVYRAYDARFEREVAVKVLPREMTHDAQFRIRFEREAKTIARLEHAAIVPVYDVGEEDGQPYFVMRYMTGGSLADRISEGRMTIEEAAYVIDRMAPALDAAHAKGIIHRDLKPGNILFDETGEPFISDFGIAKFSQSHTNMTGSAIIGTPTYMSPEQAQGEEIDGRTDIYSLGIILFEMLTGRQPYEANTPLGVVFKHVTEPVPFIADYAPDLPPVLQKVIEKALAKNRFERFGTAMSLAASLNAVARGETPDLSQTIPLTSRLSTARAKDRPTTPLPTSPPPISLSKPATKSSLPLPVIAISLVGILLIGAVILFGARLIPPLSATPTLEPSPVPSETGEAVIPPLPSSTPASSATPALAATDTPLPTPTQLPGIGGSDKIAFVRDGQIWTINPDGSELTQVSRRSGEKRDLQWLPDGQGFIYINGTCVETVSLADGQAQVVTCFQQVQYLDSFRLSPGGDKVAVSLDRELFIVPFDLEALSQVMIRSQLAALPDLCLNYAETPVKWGRWSRDGRLFAFVSFTSVGQSSAELIRVMDVHRCQDADPLLLDEFPGTYFSPADYAVKQTIPAFDWNGTDTFAMNFFKRNEGYGILYTFNYVTKEHRQSSPIKSCCYRDLTWSPDGQFIVFVFQDIDLGASSPNQLYFIPAEALASPGSYAPFSLPLNFFDPRESPQFIFRPVVSP